MNTQRVTAIIPIKNGYHYISSSIPQILSSLGLDDELILIDDSSTDGSFELIRKLFGWDPRLVLLSNPGSGIVDALNFGLLHASNEAIARFDIDDEYYQDRIEKQRSLLSDKVAAVFCDYGIIDENSAYLGTIYSPVFSFAVRVSLSQSQRTPHPGVLFSKSKCLKVGGYLENEDGVEDLSLWFRISHLGELISVPEKLFSYRIHSKSVTVEKREAILKKKSGLILENQLSSSELKLVRAQIPEAFRAYMFMSGGHQRILLFIREILLTGSFLDRFLSLMVVSRTLLEYNPFKFILPALAILQQTKRFRSARLS